MTENTIDDLIADALDFENEEQEQQQETQRQPQHPVQQHSSDKTGAELEVDQLIADALTQQEEVGQDDSTRCQQCGSLSVDDKILKTFEEAICKQCKQDDPLFKTITKTKAKEEYLISEDDFYKMKYEYVSNPRSSGWSRMKLYLVKHVRAKSMGKWKDEAGLEKERERRVKEKIKRREKRAKQVFEKSRESGEADSAIGKHIANLRGDLGHEVSPAKKKKQKKSHKETASQFVPVNETYHEHTFGDEKPVPGEVDVFEKCCTGCGLKVTFEKM